MEGKGMGFFFWFLALVQGDVKENRRIEVDKKMQVKFWRKPSLWYL